MPPFPTCKITVLKTMYNEDLSKTYRHPYLEHGPCKFFKVGDEFIVDYLTVRPEGFGCDWAWDDIHKILMILMTRGNFGTWMKDENNFVTCCTDGLKPVVFKIERLPDQDTN